MAARVALRNPEAERAPAASKLEDLHAVLDAGAAAKQGRAFDIGLKLKYDISKNWTLGAGYRMLEWGADVKDVCTFAWLRYAAASLSFRF